MSFVATDPVVEFAPAMLAQGAPDDAIDWTSLGPSAIALVTTVVLVAAVRAILKRVLRSPNREFQVAVTTLVLTILSIVVVGLMFAAGAGLGRDAVQLMGAVVVGVLGLSSTTILGNMLAGVQLRVVGAFRIGDYLRVGKLFGRITERGLFHVEIQTEDSDLETLPNLYLVSTPYRVVHKNGTIISANVSLGYDVPRKRIEACLKEAVRKTGLDAPFVHVVELGDFSVLYRAGGYYEDIREVLTRRSNLRCRIMDELFAADIEIASPTLMSTRAYQPEHRVMPPAVAASTDDEVDDDDLPMERVAFDKADEVETIEGVKARIAEVESAIAATKDVDEVDRLKARLERLHAAKKVLDDRLSK